jgi:hypothetical protein
VSQPLTMLTLLTQMPAFISVNRSERLPTSAGGRLRCVSQRYVLNDIGALKREITEELS